MIRLAFVIMLSAGLLYLATFYKLGEKPLAGHLNDIYRSAVVQEKLHELSTGVEKRVHHIERDAEKVAPKKTQEPRVAPHHQTADAKPAETPDRRAVPPTVQPAAPQLAERAKPSQDQLTDDDRSGLNHLLAQKLHTH